MKLFDKAKQKFIAHVLCLVIALFSCFSFYIVSEAAHHDCVGDNCTTCTYIDAVVEGMNQLGDGAIITTEAALINFYPQDSVVLAYSTIIVPITLISTKVRLNN